MAAQGVSLDTLFVLADPALVQRVAAGGGGVSELARLSTEVLKAGMNQSPAFLAALRESAKTPNAQNAAMNALYEQAMRLLASAAQSDAALTASLAAASDIQVAALKRELAAAQAEARSQRARADQLEADVATKQAELTDSFAETQKFQTLYQGSEARVRQLQAQLAAASASAAPKQQAPAPPPSGAASSAAAKQQPASSPASAAAAAAAASGASGAVLPPPATAGGPGASGFGKASYGGVQISALAQKLRAFRQTPAASTGTAAAQKKARADFWDNSLTDAERTAVADLYNDFVDATTQASGTETQKRSAVLNNRASADEKTILADLVVTDFLPSMTNFETYLSSAHRRENLLAGQLVKSDMNVDNNVAINAVVDSDYTRTLLGATTGLNATSGTSNNPLAQTEQQRVALFLSEVDASTTATPSK